MIHLGAHILIVVVGMLLTSAPLVAGPTAPLPWPAFLALPLAVPLLLRARGRLVRRLVPLGPLLCFAPLALLTPWVASVEGALEPLFGPRLETWPHLARLVALAPLALGHLLACGAPPGWRPASLFTRENVRVAQFLLVWAALAAYLVVSGVVAHTPWLRVRLEESTLASLAFTAVVLFGALWLLPRLLLLFVRADPLEGHHRFLAEDVAQKLGIAPPRLLLWRTDDELKNALVVSTFGPRPVLFTDAFLVDLSMTEFRAVVAHELGHVAGRHVRLMGSVLLGATLVLEIVCAPWLEASWGPAFALAFLGVMLLLAGFLSRRVELEADVYALRATRDPGALAEALVRASGGRIEQDGWRHFSVVKRLTFWRATQTDPGVVTRLRRSLNRWRQIGVLLFAAGLALTVHRGLLALPAESVVIDVREQRFADAALGFSRETLGPGTFALAGYRSYGTEAGHAELGRWIALGAARERRGEALDFAGLGRDAREALAVFGPGAHAPPDDAELSTDELAALQRVRDAIDLALLIGEAPSEALARALGHDGFDPSVELEGDWAAVAAFFAR